MSVLEKMAMNRLRFDNCMIVKELSIFHDMPDWLNMLVIFC